MAIIDIGGGGLKDTRCLLEWGFNVTVIDKEEALHEMAAALNSDRLQVVVPLLKTTRILRRCLRLPLASPSIGMCST